MLRQPIKFFSNCITFWYAHTELQNDKYIFCDSYVFMERYNFRAEVFNSQYHVGFHIEAGEHKGIILPVD